MRAGIRILSLLVLVATTVPATQAQGFMQLQSGHFDGNTMPTMPPAMSAPQMPQTPQVPQTPQIPQMPPRIPIIPVIPQTPGPIPTPINPRDVVSMPTSETIPGENASALAGVKQLDDVPAPSEVGGSAEGILVKAKAGAVFSRPSELSVNLEEGTILVSVRRPTKIAQIQTEIGTVFVSSDSEVIVSTESGVTRLINLTGLADNVKLKLSSGEMVSVKTGYEFVWADRKLRSSDLRPGDGFARRHSKLLGQGHQAIIEISLESVLNSSQLITALTRTDSERKDKKILADMSKMAAVLNYVHGVAGYTADTQVKLEVNSKLASTP